MSTEIQLAPIKATAALTAQEIRAQKNLIQEVMRDCMKDGEHYGTVPGCGPKKALMKSGAETLSFTFRLAPTFDIQKAEMPNGHREYQIICTIKNAITGMVLGSGVGSCSTMESKYRWRSGKLPDAPTEFVVPKAYWDSKRNGATPAELQTLLSKEVGEAGRYAPKKIDDAWIIMRRGEGTDERVENTDIADTYNTVLKMAKKRAHVDAILTVTAASDIFTQDIEENITEEQHSRQPETKPTQETTSASSSDVIAKCKKYAEECETIEALAELKRELVEKGQPYWSNETKAILADRHQVLTKIKQQEEELSGGMEAAQGGR